MVIRSKNESKTKHQNATDSYTYMSILNHVILIIELMQRSSAHVKIEEKQKVTMSCVKHEKEHFITQTTYGSARWINLI